MFEFEKVLMNNTKWGYYYYYYYYMGEYVSFIAYFFQYFFNLFIVLYDREFRSSIVYFDR